MRSVGGFERPAVQWLFVALGIALIVVAAAEAVSLRRARAELATLRGADLERRELALHLKREQSAREALSQEVGRLRGGPAEPAAQPTLTLEPLQTRGARPPEASVGAPAPNRSIQLRLVLPARAPRIAAYLVSLRSWSGGDTIWTRRGLPSSTIDGKAMVTAFVTGDLFVPGAYEIALTSADGKVEVASYEVTVRPAGAR